MGDKVEDIGNNVEDMIGDKVQSVAVDEKVQVAIDGAWTCLASY